jgi:hypothetical protein
MPKTIRIKPTPAARQYAEWSHGIDGEWAVVFPSHHSASVFVRLAGGTAPTRTDGNRAWRWTMPDGASATLADDPDDRTLVFVPATA